MAIVVQCPSCGVSSPAADSVSGRNVRCKKCGNPFVAQPTLDGSRSDTKKSQPADAGNPFPTLPAEFGRYRVLRLLGQGGMGAVYLAQDSELGRQVALKIPFFDAKESPHRVERFVREAQSAAALQHPNICTVFDAGRIAGTPFMTMAHVAGTPLDRAIDPDAPLPQERAAGIARKVALALAHAHGKRIVHRDLKPANVMLDESGEPVVMDFGLAKRGTRVDPNEAKLTRDGGVLGTPSYMSPEQVRGDADIGPATDVFSLGVLLFEMLTGHTPYSGGMGAVMGQILAAPVPPLAESRPDADTRLDAICQRAMAKSAADRFPSMTAFAAALGEYLTAATSSTVSVELVEPAAPPPPVVPAPTYRPAPAVAAADPFDRLTDPAPRKKRGVARSAAPVKAVWDARRIGIAAGVALAVLIPLVWLATVVLRVETPNGTLVVEISDDEVEARIKGGKLVLSGPDGKVRYTLAAGERDKKLDAGAYTIRVEGADGLTLDTPEFTLKKGDKVTVRVTLDAKKDLAKKEAEVVPRPKDKDVIPLTATTDLLSLVDVKRDILSGRWKMEAGKLIGGGEGFVLPIQEKLQVRYSLPTEYDMEAVVERTRTGDLKNPKADTRAMVFILGGRTQFGVLLDYKRGDTSLHGIGNIDGKLGLDNETTVKGDEFEGGKTVRVVCRVRSDAIRVSVDGAERIVWRGKQSRLSHHEPFWSLRDTNSIGVGIQTGEYRISSWMVKPYSAAEAINPMPGAVVPPPVPSKAVKDYKALLAELGVVDAGQKLPAVTAAYAPDDVTADAVRNSPDKYPFRAACLKAAAVLREHRAAPLPTDFALTPAKGKKVPNNADKTVLRRHQEASARRNAELEEALDELTATAEKYDTEQSKYWQASHDFLLASVRQEHAATDEYNTAIADVVIERIELPRLTDTATGWRLVPVAALRGRNVAKELAPAAVAAFDRVVKRHPDTPWAALAVEARERPLGYEWTVANLAKAAPRAGDFAPLFNGKDLTGWTADAGKLGAWAAKDGVLTGSGDKSSWLLTEKEYSDYELRLEFKLAAKGNSGIGLRSKLSDGGQKETDFEIQMLDDKWHLDNVKGVKPDQLTGAIYGVLAPTRAAAKPIGEWNAMRVVTAGRTVRVELNGVKIIDSDLDLHRAKAKEFPGLERASGRIGLQSSDTPIEFRNLEIKDLPAGKESPDPKEAAMADPFQEKSSWWSGSNEIVKSMLTVTERKADSFKATFSVGRFQNHIFEVSLACKVSGTVKDGKLVWLAKDVVAVKGNVVGDYYGTLVRDGKGDRIDFEYKVGGVTKQTFVLRLRADKAE